MIIGAPAVVAAIVVVYVLADITQAAFAQWSPKVQVAVIAAVVVVLGIGHRILSRGGAVRDLERVRSAAREASGPVPVPARSAAAVPALTNATTRATRSSQEGHGMFARRSRKQTAGIEALQEQILASNEQTRVALGAATARMEALLVSELERGHRLEQAVQSAIDALQNAAASNALDVSRALGQVADMFQLVAERIASDHVERRELAEADRLERRALTEVLAALSAPPARPPEQPSRVLGGTVFGSERPRGADVSIVDEDRWGQAAPARPRNGARAPDNDTCWIGGIEIADVRIENDKTKYWLRRRADGYIFPRAFDAEDLRFDAETAAEPVVVLDERPESRAGVQENGSAAHP